jgi:hypothetical protein
MSVAREKRRGHPPRRDRVVAVPADDADVRGCGVGQVPVVESLEFLRLQWRWSA